MLPQCFNCVKGKLHCAYLNLNAPARNALRLAQYNQNMRSDTPEEHMASYLKDHHASGNPATVPPQLSMPPVAMHTAALPVGNTAAPTQEVYPSAYIPYHIVPQMANGSSSGEVHAANGVVPPLFRPVMPVQQQSSSQNNPTMVYSQIPYQMLTATQVPQVVYQLLDQHQMPIGYTLGQMNVAPVGSIDHQMIMYRNHPEAVIAYESPTSKSAGLPISTAHRSSVTSVPNPVAQIPRSYPQGMTPGSMVPGSVESSNMAQMSPGVTYHHVNGLQIAATPNMVHNHHLSQYHPGPQVAQYHNHQQPSSSISPKAQALMAPLGAFYYSTPLILSAPVPSHTPTTAGEVGNWNLNTVKVKKEYIKSEFESEYEKESQERELKGENYSGDSPDSLNGNEKVPSIKMLLS